MDVTEERKTAIEEGVVSAMLTALDNGAITEEELPDIADFVLDGLKAVSTQDELMAFLRDLSTKWRIFSSVLVLESGEIKEKKEDAVANDVLQLVKSGNIDNAISLAQTMTETSASDVQPVGEQPTQ